MSRHESTKLPLLMSESKLAINDQMIKIKTPNSGGAKKLNIRRRFLAFIVCRIWLKQQMNFNGTLCLRPADFKYELNVTHCVPNILQNDPFVESLIP